MSGLFIGIDLGGTKIATSLTDVYGKLIASDVRPTEAHEGADGVLRHICNGIERVCQGVDRHNIRGIGVASPGPVNIKQGTVVDAPNLGWKGFPIIQRLRDIYRLPCVLENDANAAALAEQSFGAAQNVNDLIYITVSTGVGGGIICNGRILHGRDDSAGEIGHMCMEIDGPKCNCGKRGCLEALASGTAIRNEARRLMGEGRSSLIWAKASGNPDLINARLVAEAAQEDDTLAREILDRAFTYLGIGIANLIQVLNPEMILIGGGVSKIGAPLFEKVGQVIREKTFAHTIAKMPIIPPQLGDQCGTLGAAAVAIQALEH